MLAINWLELGTSKKIKSIQPALAYHNGHNVTEIFTFKSNCNSSKSFFGWCTDTVCQLNVKLINKLLILLLQIIWWLTIIVPVNFHEYLLTGAIQTYDFICNIVLHKLEATNNGSIISWDFCNAYHTCYEGSLNLIGAPPKSFGNSFFFFVNVEHLMTDKKENWSSKREYRGQIFK